MALLGRARERTVRARRGPRSTQTLTALLAFGAALLATPAVAGAVEFSSSFDSGDDGWRVAQNNESDPEAFEPPTFNTSGGNPGGYVSVTDNWPDPNPQEPDGRYWYLASPESWGGDRGGFYGGSLSFDARYTGPSPDYPPVVALFDNEGNGLYYYDVAATPPGAAWQRFEVPLRESSAWSYQGGEATRAHFMSILSDLSAVVIDGDLAQDHVGETTGIDNVVLAGPVNVARKLSLTYKRSAKAFTGKLTAADFGCVPGQKVTVFRMRGGPDAKIGTARTAHTGVFKVRDRGKPGTYYATVRAAAVPGAGNCQAAKSPNVRVR
jgi:Laminin B (Domain IV)